MAERLHRYELIERIATGGMAEVFRAIQWGDARFAREVVVKRMHAHLCEHRSMVEDFRHEAMLMDALAGPGIPTIFDFRRAEDGRWYIAMERISGPTLGECLAHGPLDIPTALALILRLCRTLDRAHGAKDMSGPRGIVHGDVTPGNVILRPDGRVTLLDFGIAGDANHRAARTGEEFGLRGTVGYIAPEAVARGGVVDRRADVFALGVLLYECTTGVRAYPEDSLAYMNAMVDSEPPDPARVSGDYPPEVAALVRRAMAHEPDARTESARALDREIRATGLAGDPSGIARLARSIAKPQSSLDVPSHPPPRDLVPLPERRLSPEELARKLSDEEHESLVADLGMFADETLSEREVLSIPPLEILEPPPIPPPPPPPPERTWGDSTTDATDAIAPAAMPSPDGVTRQPEPSIEDLFAEVEGSFPSELPLTTESGEPISSPYPPALAEYEIPISERPTPPAPAPASSVAPSSTHTRAKRPEARTSSNPPDSDGFYIYVAEDE